MGIIDSPLFEVEIPVLVKRIDTVPVAVSLSVIAAILLALLIVGLFIIYKHRPSARSDSVLSMATTVQPDGHRRGHSITTSVDALAVRPTTPGGSLILTKNTVRDSDTFSLQVHERLVRDVYRYPSSSTSTLLTTAELQDKVSMRGGDTASTLTSSVASRSVLTLDTRTTGGKTGGNNNNNSDNDSAMASAATQTSGDLNYFK